MANTAKARFARISPRKARMIVDLVRGKTAAHALQMLQFTNKSGAVWVRKVIESAVANAKATNPGVDIDSLFVAAASVDKAANSHLRRWRPRAMGRATQIQKGSSHISVTLDVRS